MSNYGWTDERLMRLHFAAYDALFQPDPDDDRAAIFERLLKAIEAADDELKELAQ